MLEKAWEHPLHGWGFATPWVPWEPAFDGWIIDHDMTVLQAHNMWVDVFFQLGLVGLVILALAFLAFIWRSWFFAVDRPRWDLRADRPYTAVTLLPSLIGAVLLVQGFSESGPLLPGAGASCHVRLQDQVSAVRGGRARGADARARAR